EGSLASCTWLRRQRTADVRASTGILSQVLVPQVVRVSPRVYAGHRGAADGAGCPPPSWSAPNASCSAPASWPPRRRRCPTGSSARSVWSVPEIPGPVTQHGSGTRLALGLERIVQAALQVLAG